MINQAVLYDDDEGSVAILTRSEKSEVSPFVLEISGSVSEKTMVLFKKAIDLARTLGGYWRLDIK